MLWPIKNAERFNKGEVKEFSAVGVEVVDDRTLRVRLENPTPYLPALTTHQTWFPVHRATIEKFGKSDDRANRWTNPGNFIGNGPFTLTEWRQQQRIVVKKNPRYRAAATVRLDEIQFLRFDSGDTEERAYRAGQVDVTMSVPFTKIETYTRDRPTEFHRAPAAET
eukprot:gene52298-71312_t